MNPYKNLPEESFWKTAVAKRSMFDIQTLWSPKFKISLEDKVVTYGSCFAQHIGKALRRRAFDWLISEKAPDGLSEESKVAFNFDVFSSRTGNIYTTSLLKQWVKWAVGSQEPAEEVWTKNGRYFDPFRPVIEPDGFASIDEVLGTKAQTLTSFFNSIKHANYFVFTLGLTESWSHGLKGYEYPMCPGTAAGDFDERVHVFKNQQFAHVLKNLVDAIELMRQINPKLKFILTVSPVPLTATKSEQHVLVATMQSKSILRAVAGQLADNRPYIDYFPSYEIINSPVFKGAFFEPNLRNVNPYGVNFVMDMFFNGLEAKYGSYLPVSDAQVGKTNSDEICEEFLLDAFGGGQ